MARNLVVPGQSGVGHICRYSIEAHRIHDQYSNSDISLLKSLYDSGFVA